MKANRKSISIIAVLALLAIAYYVRGLSGTVDATDNAEQTEAANAGEEDLTIESFLATAGADVRLEQPANSKDRSEKILRRKNYTVSINRKWNVANWVAWELNSGELRGNAQKQNLFARDPDLSEAQGVGPDEYKGSGYDRGHMCPAADNFFSHKAMEECYYMTNICPQNHKLNSGIWNDLEIACRKWAKRYGQVYIVCGPLFNSTKTARTIGKEHKIMVPDAFFKAVLCTRTKPAKAIAYVFHNNGDRRLKAICTIDELEKMTGLDFFPALPDNIENVVEAQLDKRFWSDFNTYKN